MIKAKNPSCILTLFSILFSFLSHLIIQDTHTHTHTHTVIYTLTIKKEPNERKAWLARRTVPSLPIATRNLLWVILRTVIQVSIGISLQSCSTIYELDLNSFSVYTLFFNISLQLRQILTAFLKMCCVQLTGFT